MADKNVKAQIRPSRIAVTYDNGDKVQYASKVTFSIEETVEEVVDVRAETIGLWRERSPNATLEFTFFNADAAALKEWLNLDAGTGVRGEAGFIPARKIRLHREGDGDATADILFYALSWISVRAEAVGKGKLAYVVSARVGPDDNGLTIKVGAAFA